MSDIVAGVSYRKVRDPDLLHRLIEAILTIGGNGEFTELLAGIVEQAVSLTGARYGALGILEEGGIGLREFITVGLSDAERTAIGHFPEGRGILGLVIDDPVPARIDDLGSHPMAVGFPEHHPNLSMFLGVPVHLGDGHVFGNLYLCDKEDGEPFTEVDEEIVDALGRAAGILIDKMRLRMRLRSLTVAQERERIARDLHDDVIQRLFSVGLSLESLSHSTTSKADAARLERAVSDLDETIREIRSTIFAMNLSRDSTSLRRQISDLVEEFRGPLELDVTVEINGDLEGEVDLDVAEHLLLALREALSNVIRHSQANRVLVDIETSDESVLLRVVDDGIGIPASPVVHGRGLGLKNLSERAISCGGWSELTNSEQGGAVLTWFARTKVAEATA